MIPPGVVGIVVNGVGPASLDVLQAHRASANNVRNMGIDRAISMTITPYLARKPDRHSLKSAESPQDHVGSREIFTLGEGR
jgi:hypothetical protein